MNELLRLCGYDHGRLFIALDSLTIQRSSDPLQTLEVETIIDILCKWAWTYVTWIGKQAHCVSQPDCSSTDRVRGKESALISFRICTHIQYNRRLIHRYVK